ncbi:receptor-type tyrosine-protein phosphatase eta isoform X2 [Otolemur garnettii]|uniref:receptor-type tyrosine-protein phosphatase eta isoform X2 n=1 Tax=Otolemur garnettii TaxID=30611 RepID=UPI000C7EC66F|nr:receptor-type tyrosine-protein phosphatase eta isoform X2 [Otolemur garnettii]
MKPAAREARLPPRSPGLRWALPLLLLVLRRGQMVYAGDCVSCDSFNYTSSATGINFDDIPGNFSVINVTDSSGWSPPIDPSNTSIDGLAPGTRYHLTLSNGSSICCQQVETRPSSVFDIEAVSSSPTNVTLTWKNNDTAASEYEYRVMNTVGDKLACVTRQTRCDITDLSPETFYQFSITPRTGSKIWGDPSFKNVTTAPAPTLVSGLHVHSVDTRKVAVSWSNDNGTASCWMLLEGRSLDESTQNLTIRILGLKPGNRCCFNLYLLESNETQRELVISVSDVNGTERIPADTWPQACDSATTPVCVENFPGPTAPSSGQQSQDMHVLLVGLKPGTQYKTTVYSQAADDTEGKPQTVEFTTNASQVFDVTVVNISATSLTLTWKITDNESSSVYTYEIVVATETSFLSVNISEMQAVIPGLTSSTLYNITVYPLLGDTRGMPGSLQVYTPPGPVSNFQVTSVGAKEIGLAWSSNDSDSFKINISQDGAGESWVKTTTDQTVIIDGLHPGTKYHFEIFPQGPNGTQGPSQTIYGRTAPSAVFNIRAIQITTTEMELAWESGDNASEYIYHLNVQSEHGSNQMSTSHKEITLLGLIPGTLYNITIYPEVDHVPGDNSYTAYYTRPNNVSNIEINTTTTEAALSWKNSDEASPTYSYLLLIERVSNSSNDTREVVTNIGATDFVVTELMPGSSYTVEIFTQVGNVTESLTPGWQSFCTFPASVASFHCDMIPRKPALVLTWACPPGANEGFELQVSSGTWYRVTRLESCFSENGTEYRTEVMYLNFSTSYNISVTTVSCEKMAVSVQSTCVTGITDPLAPDGSPNITTISHNSVKVSFSGFEASHGPIKAYAVILTTGDADRPSTSDLQCTYADFKKGTSHTYVTYLIVTEEKGHSPGSSEVSKYEIDVGNESNTFGYYNGKLEPLGSYRVCVAGFTNITFLPQNNGLIDGAASYVSFSRFSEAVFLPQDPGVICGAVFGCIFGALVIVAVGGFIFWRKKRKDAKNNEVSFSQIKPKKSKLIRVENFEAYFKKQQADSNCGFAEEYEDLKLVGINQPKYAAEMAENRGKNRYNNVLPYEISRVKLSIQTHSTDDYINANYMPGYHSKKEFIATQGPLPNTLKDFWRMVWEKNVYAIIMLTKCVEQGRTKCEEYWPSKQAQDYGDITVAMTSEMVLPEWTIRDFTVKNVLTSESHPLRQFHFTSWPDHGVPDTTDLLINFRYLVRDYMKQSPPESPILVHCSAGVGRTGTFIAIDRLIYQIENENTVDVYGIVYDLRMHRPLMVQTEDQYVFLNQCVLDIIRSQKDSKVDLIYQNTTAMTIYENLAPVTTFGKTNGYIA